MRVAHPLDLRDEMRVLRIPRELLGRVVDPERQLPLPPDLQ